VRGPYELKKNADKHEHRRPEKFCGSPSKTSNATTLKATQKPAFSD
jgi:hypothetical protein